MCESHGGFEHAAHPFIIHKMYRLQLWTEQKPKAVASISIYITLLTIA